MTNHAALPTRSLPRTLTAGLAAVALLVGASACEQENETATVSVAGGAVDANDADLLRAVLLEAGDLRGGWAPDFEQDDDLLSVSCLGVDVTADPASAGRAARLADGDGEVEHRVFLFASADDGRRHVDAFASESARDCLAAAVRHRAVENGSDGEVVVEQFRIDAHDPRWLDDVAGVDDAAVYRASLGVGGYGITVQLHVDIVAVRVGRAVSIMSFAEVGEPVADDTQRGAVEVVVERLRGDSAV